MKRNPTASNRLGTLFAAIDTQPAPAPAARTTKAKKPSASTSPAIRPTGTNTEAIAPDRRNAGRQRRYTERIVPLSLSLAPEHIRYVDAICTAITQRTGKPCSRGEVGRAIIDAILSSGVDLTRATSDVEIRQILTLRLNGE